MAKPTKPQNITTRNDLTATYIRSILDYNPKTGILKWRYRTDISPRYLKRWNERYAGTVAGEKSSSQHIAISLNKRSYVAHRLIWLIVTGEWPKCYIDHKDNDAHNNRWCNLREATPKQNQANQKTRKNNTSGFKGVSWSKQHGKWRAQIRHKNTNKYLGLFNNAKEAHAAYCFAAKRLHKKFARFY